MIDFAKVDFKRIFTLIGLMQNYKFKSIVTTRVSNFPVFKEIREMFYLIPGSREKNRDYPLRIAIQQYNKHQTCRQQTR